MKQKGIFYLAAIAILMASQASAQTFSEIFTDGWGQGRRFIRPCFADLDNDGLLDLLLGEHSGGIHHLEQTAAGSAQFSSISKQFNGIDAGSRPTPTFTDLDNDTRLDLIIGKQNGTISHYEQDGNGSTSFSLVSESFNDIDVGGYATPRFIDLDEDLLLDLLVGKTDGTIAHYEQNASGSAEFSLVTDSFNLIDVGGIATPCFTDLDADGLWDMVVGVNLGHLYHYEQASQGSYEFDLVSDNFNGIDIDAQACPEFTDVDNDGLLDLMIGGMFGFLYFYEQEAVASATMQLISNNILPGIDIGQHAAPAFTDLNFDGVGDMIVGKDNGNLSHFEQDDWGSTLFNFVEDTLSEIDVGSYAMPVLLDIEGDALMDMLIGQHQGRIFQYRQASSGSPDFTLVTDSFNDISLGDEAAPALVDLNDDGLYELIIGRGDGTLCHYEQDAPGSMDFSLISDHFNNIDLDYVARPCFTDLQDDGLWDMIIGYSGETLYHYRQNAAGSLEFSLITDNFMDIVTDGYSAPVFADINRDGLEDLFVGCYNGGIRFFQAFDNTGLDQESTDPASLVTLSVHPNPVHTSARIQFTLQRSAEVDITIYNILGEKVRLLVNDFRDAGSHTIYWDGTDANGHSLACGTYICSVEANGYRDLIKLMVVE